MRKYPYTHFRAIFIIISISVMFITMYYATSKLHYSQFISDNVTRIFADNKEKELACKKIRSDLPKLYVAGPGRLGNTLFVVISGYGLARSSGHQLVIHGDEVKSFSAVFPHLELLCEDPPENTTAIWERTHATYGLPHPVPSGDCMVGYYLQSYRYSQNYTSDIKRRLKFSDEIYKNALAFLKKAGGLGEKLYGLKKSWTYIGIHARRGDLATEEKTNLGYIPANAAFIHYAMIFYRKKYGNVVFIVCSDDMEWSKHNMHDPDVWFQEYPTDPATDLCLLSSCDHIIMTVGTFGWMAGWFAGGDVIYQVPSMNVTSDIGKAQSDEDFYPPEWIPSTSIYHSVPKVRRKHRIMNQRGSTRTYSQTNNSNRTQLAPKFHLLKNGFNKTQVAPRPLKNRFNKIQVAPHPLKNGFDKTQLAPKFHLLKNGFNKTQVAPHPLKNGFNKTQVVPHPLKNGFNKIQVAPNFTLSKTPQLL